MSAPRHAERFLAGAALRARSTDRSAGFRELVVQPTDGLTYCWIDVDVD